MNGNFVRVFCYLAFVSLFNFNFCDSMQNSSTVKNYSVQTDKHNLYIDLTDIKSDDIEPVFDQFFSPKFYLYEKTSNTQNKSEKAVDLVNMGTGFYIGINKDIINKSNNDNKKSIFINIGDFDVKNDNKSYIMSDSVKKMCANLMNMENDNTARSFLNKYLADDLANSIKRVLGCFSKKKNLNINANKIIDSIYILLSGMYKICKNNGENFEENEISLTEQFDGKQYNINLTCYNNNSDDTGVLFRKNKHEQSRFKFAIKCFADDCDLTVESCWPSYVDLCDFCDIQINFDFSGNKLGITKFVASGGDKGYRILCYTGKNFVPSMVDKTNK